MVKRTFIGEICIIIIIIIIVVVVICRKLEPVVTVLQKLKLHSPN